MTTLYGNPNAMASPIRTNYARNPRFGSGTLGEWINGGLASFSLVTLGSGGAPAPTAAMTEAGITRAVKCVADGNFDYTGVFTDLVTIAGHTYAGGAWVYIESFASPTNDLLYLQTSNGAEGGNQYLDRTLGAWQRPDHGAGLFSTVFPINLLIGYQQGGGTPAATYYVTGAMVEEANIVGSFFDGAYPEFVWSGLANASSSSTGLGVSVAGGSGPNSASITKFPALTQASGVTITDESLVAQLREAKVQIPGGAIQNAVGMTATGPF